MDFLVALNRIRVFALVGESGTGKSFRSKLVAQKHKVDFIIDDGLLIKKNRILAGQSAKKENSFLAAVKIALFDKKSHRDEVARRLQTEKYKRVLILGTSEKMVHKIAIRLQLPIPFKLIKIEEITTQEDIEKAVRSRRIEGKHVIPLPSIEVKKSYSNIFLSTIQIFKHRISPAAVPTLHEKSIVRPEYSKRERVAISNIALNLFVIHCVGEYNKDIRIKKILVKDTDLGYRLAITIDVPYGIQLGDNIHKMQHYITENIERYTGILIEEINVIIDKITEQISNSN
ncbi:MAG: hypothetical protein LBC80_10075 [Treponema sp.]|nr:hypothetical protein [Treponema sp.]